MRKRRRKPKGEKWIEKVECVVYVRGWACGQKVEVSSKADR